MRRSTFARAVGPHRTRKSVLVILGVVALTATACGTRANKGQVDEALGLTGRGRVVAGPAGGASDNSGSDLGGVTQDTSQAAQASGGTGVGGGTAGSGSSGGATASNPNDVAAAPAGGNGGATDVGVTATSITAANISILTGPVPGLFAGAVNGTDAFFQYQNSLGGVYGRQLKLLPGDDGFDCGQNKALTEADMSKAVAFVGSFSLFDNCGAEVFNANPTVPDVHNALSLAAQQEKNNFSSQPIRQGMATGVINYFKGKAPDAVTAAASLVGDVQSAKDSWTGERAAMVADGYKFAYERTYEPTETDFTADIIQMKAKGVKMLFLIAADVKAIARIESAAAQQGFRPEITALGASAYDPTLVPLAGGGAALEGDYFFLPTAMYLGEDRGWNQEVNLFLTWLQRTHPGANPDLFTVYGWASARLFVEALKAVGPKVTRPALIGALRNIHTFDSNTLYPPADPADRTPPNCYIIARIHDGKFGRVDDPPNGYRCDGPYWYYPNGTP